MKTNNPKSGLARIAIGNDRNDHMAKHYVLGLMAANRTGILAAVSTALTELSGNIHDIRLTVIENFFTILLSADFPEYRDPAVIIEHLEGVGRPFGLSVLLRDPAEEPPTAISTSPCEVYQLVLEGEDQPGVLARFSARLAREQIDITDLYGWRNDVQKPTILLELALPHHVDLGSLRRDLEEISAGYKLKVTLGPVGAGAVRDPRPLKNRMPAAGRS